MNTKIDLKKEWKQLYSPSAKAPSLVEVPAANYLMIDGQGNPNQNKRFTEAIETLFPLAYAIKFLVRKETAIDYGVMPLEGQYWGTPVGQTHFREEDKDLWSWTLMILQPEWVSQAIYQEACLQVQRKKDVPLLPQLRFERFHEGLVTQILHIGSFNDEEANVIRMHQLAYESGYKLCGHHHEIYLNDFTRTAEERLKTILRHPIER